MERRRPVVVIDFKSLFSYAVGLGLGYVYGRFTERRHTIKVVSENTDSLLKAWSKMLNEYVDKMPDGREVARKVDA